MADEPKKDKQNSEENPTVTLPGTVEKIIPPAVPFEPEKAPIVVEGDDHLYREIRLETVLKDADGKEVSLKPAADVEVTIEAEGEATEPAKRNRARVGS